MNCPFCATGQAGLTRNLSTAEIVDQVVAGARALARRARCPAARRRVTNIVFMGMGEPLANYKRVVGAVRRLTEPGARRPRALRSAASPSPPSAWCPAIGSSPTRASGAASRSRCTRPTTSCATRWCRSTRAGRSREVLDAAWEYAARTGRRVSIEYALIRDINDQAWRADLLGRLLKGKLVHVNLIPLNPTPGSKWTASRPEDERAFVRRLAVARRAGDGPGHPRPGDRRRLRPARRHRVASGAGTA